VAGKEFAEKGVAGGMAILLKTYAHCIDGQADAANKRIADALDPQDTEPGPGEGDDSEEAFQKSRSAAQDGQLTAPTRRCPCPSVRQPAPEPASTDI
jgi:hypothetical protein